MSTEIGDDLNGLSDFLPPSSKKLRPMEIGQGGLVVDQVPGTTSKYFVYDEKDRIQAVVISSAPEEPELISVAVARSQEARESLGPLGKAVLTPTNWGTIGGLSFAVYPYCRPLSSYRYVWIIQRAWMRPRILAWLRDAMRVTLEVPTADEVARDFREPLLNLAGLTALPQELRDSALTALDRLDTGLWRPKYSFMHGDFWNANILSAPGTRGWSRFVLIDWPGSLVRGYAILDLLSVAPSLRLKGAHLRSEVESHCRILGCEFDDARCYLLAGLGYIAQHRGNFPWDRYKVMATNLLKLLTAVGG